MPADSDLVSLPHRWRPMGTRFAGLFLFGALVFVSLFAWWALGPEMRARFAPGSTFIVVLMYLGSAVVVHAVTRCRLDATEDGLVVVNGYRTHRLAWAQALNITLPQGAPWAVLDLADGTSVSVIAIQAADGERAKRSVRQVRVLLDQASGVFPGDLPGGSEGPDAPRG